MKKRRALLAGALMGLFVAIPSAEAQSYWLLSYRGTETSADAPEGATRLVTRRVTESDFVRDCAAGAGSTSVSNLALVLHLDAESLGDRIEVINTSDPNLFRCDVLKLFFSESFTNSAGTLVKRFSYVYTEQDGHSRGSAILTRRMANPGGSGKVSIEVEVQYWREETNGTLVCTGVFTARQPLNLP